MITPKKNSLNIIGLFEPIRVFIVLISVVVIYLLPLGEQPEFIEHKGEIIEISQTTPILKSMYPQASYATCGPGGTGTNCHTGCCRAGACVVCDPQPDDQPPVIDAILNCSQMGNDNWCIGNLSLNLSASDPQGYAILISGTINGVDFACTPGAASCSLPISENGIGTLTYRVDSSSGMFDSGSTTYQLDASTPDLNGSLSGVAGNNNWYKSNVTLTATASDSISDLASIESAIDGSTWTTYTSALTITEGTHTVDLKAIDNAGNITQTTQTVQVDTITPTINVSRSGTLGSNSWYVSNVTITPSASDPYPSGTMSTSSGQVPSGVSTLEINIDGNGYIPYTVPIIFTDGIHSYQFRATDNAGNVTQTSQQTIQIDTTTPVINLSLVGTMGTNGWYVSNVTVTANVQDATSTVGLVEAKMDNGSWFIANTPLSFSDGLHTYQFRVTDNAGNVITIPIQNLKVDTIAPSVDMFSEIDLGDTLLYELQDDGSGLSIYRAVIEDEDEKYKKIVWLDSLTGSYTEGSIRWDGKFADGTQAGWGEYYITLKISDQAGNETFKTAAVNVGLFSFLEDIPPFTPSLSSTLPDSTTQTESPSLTFGGENNNTTAEDESSSTEGGETIGWGEGDYVSSGFTISSEDNTTSGTNPLTPTGILLGAAATAIIGSTLADWERKREEERKRREEEEAKAARMNIKARREEEKAREEAVRERWAQDKAEEQYLKNYAEHIENKMAKIDAIEDAKWTSAVTAIQKREEERARQERMNQHMEEKMALVDAEEDAEWALAQQAEKEKLLAIDAARWAGIAAIEQEKEEENEEKVGGGGKPLFAIPTQDEDPPPPSPWKFWEPGWTWKGAILAILGFDPNYQPPPAPTPTSTLEPWWFTPSPTPTTTPSPTVPPLYTPTPRPTSTYIEDQLQAYGIQLRGVDNELVNTILQATQLAAQTFQPLTGGTPQQSFIMSHGTLAIIVDENAEIGNGICETERVVPNTRYWPYGQNVPDFNVQNTITCIEPPTLTNLLHEFVHAFDNNYRIFGSPNREHLLSDSLGDLIVNNVIVRQVFPGYVERTPLGFLRYGEPARENFWTTSLSEEFADTQLNAILDGTDINQDTNGFSDDDYGNARRDEWNSLMHQWQNDMQNRFNNFDK